MKATTFFSVRMPAAESRRVKVLAAGLELSLQEVVRQALDAWVQEHDPQARRRRERQQRQAASSGPAEAHPGRQAGAPAGADAPLATREATKQAPFGKLRAGSRLLGRAPAATGLVARDDSFVQAAGARSTPQATAAGRGAAEAASPASGARPRNLSWLKDAERLDWSQCRAVKIRRTQHGRVWFFRGTRVALPAVLHDFMNGRSLREVLARHPGLTAEQAKAAVEFAWRALVQTRVPQGQNNL